MPLGEKGSHHDTHALPPKFIQDAYWHYNKLKTQDLDNDLLIIDFARGLTGEQTTALRLVNTIGSSNISAACGAFQHEALDSNGPLPTSADAPVYEHRDFPGMVIRPRHERELNPSQVSKLFQVCYHQRYRSCSSPNHAQVSGEPKSQDQSGSRLRY